MLLIKCHSYIDNFRSSAIFLAGDYKIDLWRKFLKLPDVTSIYKDWKDLNEKK